MHERTISYLAYTPGLAALLHSNCSGMLLFEKFRAAKRDLRRRAKSRHAHPDELVRPLDGSKIRRVRSQTKFRGGNISQRERTHSGPQFHESMATEMYGFFVVRDS